MLTAMALVLLHQLGMTPLMHACRGGALPFVQWLVWDRGCDARLRDDGCSRVSGCSAATPRSALLCGAPGSTSHGS
jgi:hypothetical protein